MFFVLCKPSPRYRGNTGSIASLNLTSRSPSFSFKWRKQTVEKKKGLEDRALAMKRAIHRQYGNDRHCHGVALFVDAAWFNAVQWNWLILCVPANLIRDRTVLYLTAIVSAILNVRGSTKVDSRCFALMQQKLLIVSLLKVILDHFTVVQRNCVTHDERLMLHMHLIAVLVISIACCVPWATS